MAGYCNCTCIGSQIQYIVNMTIEQDFMNSTPSTPKEPAGKVIHRQ